MLSSVPENKDHWGFANLFFFLFVVYLRIEMLHTIAICKSCCYLNDYLKFFLKSTFYTSINIFCQLSSCGSSYILVDSWYPIFSLYYVNYGISLRYIASSLHFKIISFVPQSRPGSDWVILWFSLFSSHDFFFKTDSRFIRDDSNE